MDCNGSYGHSTFPLENLNSVTSKQANQKSYKHNNTQASTLEPCILITLATTMTTNIQNCVQSEITRTKHNKSVNVNKIDR
jgi:hypothetical protein